MSTLPSSSSSASIYRSVFILASIVTLVDFILLGLHSVHVVNPAWVSKTYSIEFDRGVPEFFQYFKELAILILVFVSAVRLGMKGLFAWAALFLYILVDDAFSVHEVLGRRLAEIFEFAPDHLKPRDVGELLVSVVAGGVLLTAIGLSYLLGCARFRSITHDLLLMFATLAFFGVFVDLLHSAIKLGSVFSHVLALIEDGGEMLVMSLILIYAWALRVVPAERRIYFVEAGWGYLRQRFF